jgi:hypothetical protein
MKKTNSKNNFRVSSRKAGRVKNRNRQRKNRSKRIFTSNAPLAVSDDLQQSVVFRPGTKESSLKMTACIPLYQICSNGRASSANTYGSLIGYGSAGYPKMMLSSTEGHTIISSDDVLVNYISPVFKLIAKAFVRYRVDSCEFLYEPQSTATVEDRLVFAYASDPLHPRIMANTPSNSNQANLLALSDSIAFMPWKSWVMDVSSEVKQDLLYTFNQSLGVSDNRFNMFGCIGCVSSTLFEGTTVAPRIYGILYARLTFEFVEFCPLISGFTPSLERKDERDDDEFHRTCDSCRLKGSSVRSSCT